MILRLRGRRTEQPGLDRTLQAVLGYVERACLKQINKDSRADFTYISAHTSKVWPEYKGLYSQGCVDLLSLHGPMTQQQPISILLSSRIKCE